MIGCFIPFSFQVFRVQWLVWRGRSKSMLEFLPEFVTFLITDLHFRLNHASKTETGISFFWFFSFVFFVLAWKVGCLDASWCSGEMSWKFQCERVCSQNSTRSAQVLTHTIWSTFKHWWISSCLLSSECCLCLLAYFFVNENAPGSSTSILQSILPSHLPSSIDFNTSVLMLYFWHLFEAE